MPLNPSVAAAAPTMSTRPPAFSSRLSGTRHQVIASTTAASGKLMKKIQRQEACSTSQPPSSGPTPAAMEVKPDHVPMARPLSSLGNEALMRARLPGTSRAAPTPCTARAAMR